MESGNLGSVMDMVPAVCYSQIRSMQGSTVVDGKMERSTYVFYILLHIHAANTCMYTLIYFAFLQGYGTYFYNSSAVYEGEWSEDQRSGWGRMYYGSGDIYEGEWMKDKTHGQGIIRFGKRSVHIFLF